MTADGPPRPTGSSLIGETERPKASVLQILADPAARPRQRLRAARQLIVYGRIDEATAILTELARLPRLRDQAEELLRSCGELRQFDASQASSMPAHAADAGFWVKPARSDVALVAFAGKARKVGVSIYFLERLLGRFGFSLIFLFDWRDGYFLDGVAGLGATLDETAGALRRTCAELGARRVICLGQSSGGFGALRYGLALDAAGVIAFSPVLPKSPEMTAAVGERLGRPVGAEELDLPALYAARKSAPPRLAIFHGADNEADGRAAQAFAGVPGATIRPLPGVAVHGTLQDAVAKGAFFDLVNPVFAELTA